MAVNALILNKSVSDMSATFFNIPNCRVNYPPRIISNLYSCSCLHIICLSKMTVALPKSSFLLKFLVLVRGKTDFIAPNKKVNSKFFYLAFGVTTF